MENAPKIFEAIANVMDDIGSVGKNKKSQQGYMFRGIDDVMNALNPALVKHKVFIVPEILEQKREERATKNGGTLIFSICKIKYSFFTTDGSHVDCIVIGEGMDSSDKATNKAMAIAFKYACFQVFCIPTEEMAEPDKENHDVSHSEDKPRDKNLVNAEQVGKIQVEMIRTGVTEEFLCKHYNLEKLIDMSANQWNNAMEMFKKTPDRKKSN